MSNGASYRADLPSQQEALVAHASYQRLDGYDNHETIAGDNETKKSSGLLAPQNTLVAGSGRAPIGPDGILPMDESSSSRRITTSSDNFHSQVPSSASGCRDASAGEDIEGPGDRGTTDNVLPGLGAGAETSLPLALPDTDSVLHFNHLDEEIPTVNVRKTKQPVEIPVMSAEDDLHWETPLVEPPLPSALANAEAFHPHSLLREELRSQYNDYDADTDSALGDVSYASSMTSVTSSIYESVSENGRTYHSYKPGKYVLPNDSKEQGRLDTQHYMLCEAIGGRLFCAPLEPHRVNRVLDIATGTGIWAMEFADDFPNAEVIGTDLTPIQPRWCPPNCRFEVDDAEDEWVFTAPFSYIHGRTLMTCFKDPREVIFKCVENLEEGGWLEFQDGQVPFEYEGPNAPQMISPFSHEEPISMMQKWEKLTLEASIRGERPWNNVKHYKRWFEEAGLVDVTEQRSKLPLGTWDGLTRREKRIGAVQFANIYHGLEGMTLRNLARLGWTFEESKALVEDVRKEMLSRTYRPCTFSVVVMGRKPFSNQCSARGAT